MRRIIWLLISIVWLSPLVFAAEPVSSQSSSSLPPTMTLEQALALAVRQNPQYKAEQARIAILEAERKTAGARPNPFLLSDNGIAEHTYRLGIEQLLETGGKRQRRIALVNTQLNVARAELNVRYLELRANVRRAYTQLYNLQERQKTYQNLLQVSQELVDIAKKRQETGDIATLDVLQTEIMNVNINNDLQGVSVEEVQAQSRLNALLNQPLTHPITVEPPRAALQPEVTLGQPVLAPSPGGLLSGSLQATNLDVERLIQQASAHRPELKSNSSQIEATYRQIAVAKANRVPNLRLAAGPDLVTGQGGGFSAFVIGNVEIPLFNRQQGPIQEALARRNQLTQDQLALKNRIALEVMTAYTAYVGNQARVQRYETQLLPYAVAVVDKSRRAFQEGKASILTPIAAQQAYMNSRLGYLQAILDYQNAISDLERAVGAGL